MKKKTPGRAKRKLPIKTISYLASFPEMNPNPIAEVDFDGRIHYLNPAAKRLFPDLEAKQLEHPWLVDWQSVTDKFRGQAVDSALRAVAIGTRYYEQVMYCVAQGKRVRIYGVDITESKQAEQALRESEARFRLALKNAPVSVAAQDRDLRFLWAYNQRTLDPNAVIGKTDNDIFPRKSRRD